MRHKVFLGIQTLGMIQETCLTGRQESPAQKARLDHSSRLNLTLTGCSSAEPASVSVQQYKIQISNLYLQPVKIPSHLPVEAVKNFNINIKLPNNGEFFMFYRDFASFDFNTNTGEIKLLDLNFDSFEFGSLKYEAGENIEAEILPLPESINMKYKGVFDKNEMYLNSKAATNSTTAGKAVPCDSSGNGNVSFSECYFCFNGSCAQDANCFTLCYGIGDIAGAIGTGVPLCQGSIAAACVYISIAY